MRLLKPAWVSHEGKPIFSIDIHPDDSRFATGGQGSNSGMVAIWSMDPIRDEKAENDENVPKLICQMDNHLACVNCVRWSIDGRYLASSGDDKLIMIWQFSRSGGMSASFGSHSTMVNTETWRAVHILRGHTGDVLDLAWSPDKSYLASCSIDNTVIIWNALKFPEQTTVLRGHTGLVKGVTWDPVGKYLASQSDDRSVRIWNTFSWQVESVITKPFEECGGTTHVLRLNWSPDGQYIVSAHAMNNSGPTSQIIEREGWQTKMDFVGHRKAITVVRFNQRIFSKKFKRNPNQLIEYTCCAVGSRDRSVSVWLTSLKRPLVVIHDLFNDSVLDITWSASGTELMCCSWDGTVAYFNFTIEEIGKPMSPLEKSNLHRKLYGESILMSKNSATNRIIESTEVLKIQQQKNEKQRQQLLQQETAQQQRQQLPKQESSKQPAACSQQDSNSPTSQSKQIETRTKDGRRRITPIFLAPQPDVGDVPLPFTSGGASSMPVFSSSTETSSIVVEKKNEITSPIRETSGSRIIKENSRSMQDVFDTRSTKPAEPSVGVGTVRQTDAGNSGESLQSAADAVRSQRVEPATAVTIAERTRDLPEGVERMSTDSPHQHQSGHHHKVRSEDIPKKKDGRGRPRKDRLMESNKFYSSPAAPSTASIAAAPSIVERELLPAAVVNTGLHLPMPAIDGRKILSLSSTSAHGIDTDSEMTLQVDNCFRTGASITLHRIRCTDGSGRLAWEEMLASKISIVAGSSCLVAAACEDRCMHVYSSTSGRRICPPIVLESAASRLCCSAMYVMVVTSRGAVLVWNMRTLTCTVKNTSVESILSGGQLVLDECRLTDQGVPVVSLNNGQSYTYHCDLSSWVILASPDNLLYQCSDYQSSATRSSSGLLSELQSSTRQRSSAQNMQMLRADAAIQRSSTVGHLENQVACSLAIKSAKEFHFWLHSYVRYLVQEAMESKLREVCDDLLGPVRSNSSSSRWQPTVLGYRKRTLLSEILPIVGTNLRLQRLFAEYQQQLSATD